MHSFKEKHLSLTIFLELALLYSGVINPPRGCYLHLVVYCNHHAYWSIKVRRCFLLSQIGYFFKKVCKKNLDMTISTAVQPRFFFMNAHCIPENNIKPENNWRLGNWKR